jgi:hypothetical protein
VTAWRRPGVAGRPLGGASVHGLPVRVRACPRESHGDPVLRGASPGGRWKMEAGVRRCAPPGTVSFWPGSPGSGSSAGHFLPVRRQRRECHAIHTSGANRATIECHRCHRSNASRPAMMRMPALVANSRRLVATGGIEPTGSAPRLSPSSCRSAAVRRSCSDTSGAAPCSGSSSEGSATYRLWSTSRSAASPTQPSARLQPDHFRLGQCSGMTPERPG